MQGEPGMRDWDVHVCMYCAHFTNGNSQDYSQFWLKLDSTGERVQFTRGESEILKSQRKKKEDQPGCPVCTVVSRELVRMGASGVGAHLKNQTHLKNLADPLLMRRDDFYNVCCCNSCRSKMEHLGEVDWLGAVTEWIKDKVDDQAPIYDELMSRIHGRQEITANDLLESFAGALGNRAHVPSNHDESSQAHGKRLRSDSEGGGLPHAHAASPPHSSASVSTEGGRSPLWGPLEPVPSPRLARNPRLRLLLA